MTTGFEENRALLAGELDWKQYLKPQNMLDLDECAHVDQFNESLFEYNNAMLPRINELRLKMGDKPWQLEAPPKYLHTAKRKLRERMWTPEYRMLGAVRFLAKRDKFAERDYALVDGAKLADDMAEREEIERRIATGPIDITDAVGRAHTKNCTCELRWDGTSERCIGMGARLCWKRHKDHHFEEPNVYPAVR